MALALDGGLGDFDDYKTRFGVPWLLRYVALNC
jgi:hypothetical protein